MNFQFLGADGLLAGISHLAGRCGFSVSEGGIPVRCEKTAEDALHVTYDGERASIRYGKPCRFFRALGYLVEAVREGNTALDVKETAHFEMNGVMFDMSQGNAAFTVSAVKDVLEQFALMGLDTLMLYVEDNYEVKEQPYFGYMRPRYTQDEMRQMDDYAFELGIEMIPCIQTLAHLPDVLRWRVFSQIKDYDACLLVGEEKTYEFIDQLIRNASAPFRSKRIHIGMDEAWELGSGQYLRKNGYKSQTELMKEHLARVNAIVKKYGLEPMMWDDMYFQAAFGLGGYRTEGREIPDDVRALVPDNMECIYWDYTGASDERFRMQKKLTDRLIFAGGCWAWLGYGMAFTHTLNATNSALALCHKWGIKKVFMTTWGDNGAEAPQTFNLAGAQIYAENGYADTFDYDKFVKRFRFCTGGDAEDFRALDFIDRTPDFDQPEIRLGWACASKYLLWQDVLTGLIDKNIEGVELDAHYAALAQKMAAAEERNPAFVREFRMMHALCDVLAIKSQIGLRLTAAYRAGDRAELKKIAAETLPELSRRVAVLREAHRETWFSLYKPFGWDVMDLRYGGLLARIESARKETEDFLGGKTERIEELEAERLYFHGEAGTPIWYDFYGKIVSPSRIDPMA